VCINDSHQGFNLAQGIWVVQNGFHKQKTATGMRNSMRDDVAGSRSRRGAASEHRMGHGVFQVSHRR